MASPVETFTVNIDTTAIKAQVSEALGEPLKHLASQFREAAAALDPEGEQQYAGWLYNQGYGDAKAGKSREYPVADRHDTV